MAPMLEAGRILNSPGGGLGTRALVALLSLVAAGVAGLDGVERTLRELGKYAGYVDFVVAVIHENFVVQVIATVVLCIAGIAVAAFGSSARKSSLTIVFIVTCASVALSLGEKIFGDAVQQKLRLYGEEDIVDYIVIPVGVGAGVGLLLGGISCFLLKAGLVVLGCTSGFLLSQIAITEYAPNLGDSYVIAIYCACAVIVGALVFFSFNILVIIITGVSGAFITVLGLQLSAKDDNLLKMLLSSRLWPSGDFAHEFKDGLIDAPLYNSKDPLVKYAFVIFVCVAIAGMLIQLINLLRKKRRAHPM